MKIAIVAPCPAPYTVGGAEKLWWGLASHINEKTGHQAEIIKLPTTESDLASLIRAYQAFSELDLGAFDIVISGKYPAWMVSHPRHACYMLHRLRGFYDCYYGANEINGECLRHPAVAGLLQFIARWKDGSRSALPEFFARWSEIMTAPDKPQGLLDFPGPIGRALVHWLDGIGLSNSSISHFSAISATVANRPGYFPEGAEVEVLYPPPHRAMARGRRFKYFYTVSRLDHIKRVGLVVEAMRRVKGDVRLVVGGTGPEESRLHELAKGDTRITFTGFENDARVLEHYQDALAVPFVPWQEDYGLIAVEAMQCGKPVITARDSGGPCELVQNGVTGIICDDNVESLAAAMQRFVDDRALAGAMGERAHEASSHITWDVVVRGLLREPMALSPVRTSGRTRKLVVASTFPIYPPRHGGQVRSFNIYRALAPEFETVIVSLGPPSLPVFSAEIAPGVREVRIPMSPEHARREKKVEAEVGTPVTDVLMPELYKLTPAYQEALSRESEGACAAVASHPYLYPALAALGLPIWYEAQDFELRLKRPLFEKVSRGGRLIDAVLAVDKACTGASEIILCASASDAEDFVNTFGARRERIHEVPNGTDVNRIAFTSEAQRQALKDRLGIPESRVAFFMGSGHWPNIEAVKRIFEFAQELPGVAFAVIGSVCYAFDATMMPQNVLFLGEVDDITRNLCLQAFDVALNPVEHGSGTNIKMLDYFAAGLPVVTTEEGSRGLKLQGEAQCLVRGVGDFPAAIEEVLGEGRDAAVQRAVVARAHAEREFDWDGIVARIKPTLIALADSHPADVKAEAA